VWGEEEGFGALKMMPHRSSENSFPFKGVTKTKVKVFLRVIGRIGKGQHLATKR
jgi:hypothetical protein